jgi:hypothetical protein
VSLSDLGDRDAWGDLGFDPDLLLGDDGDLVAEIGAGAGELLPLLPNRVMINGKEESDPRKR